MPDGVIYKDAFAATAGRDPLSGARCERESWVRSLFYMQAGDGFPGPSLEMRLPGHAQLLWPVEPGDRKFTIFCRHSGHTPRPRVRIASNTALGVPADVTADAQDTTDWHKITLDLSVSAVGVLEVYLEMRSDHGEAWVRWDNASVE